MGALMGAAPWRAGVEDLLPLLVFVVIWWVSSRREQKRRRQGEKTPPPWSTDRTGQPAAAKGAQGVDPMELLRQMLFGGMELPPLPMEPPLPEAPADSGDQLAAAREGEVRGGSSPPLTVPMEAVKATPRPEWVREPTRPAVKPAGAVAVPTRPAKGQALVLPSRRELQRAVIWSEILAPPVSLREEESGGCASPLRTYH